MRSLLFLSIFVLLFFVNHAYASILHGYIYDVNDFSLFKGCVIEINSTPIIRVVSHTGVYNFSLKEGCYNINVTCYRNGVLYGKSDADLCVSNESYERYDFLIFPEIDDEDVNVLSDESELYTDYPFKAPLLTFNVYYLFVLIIPPIIGIYFYFKKRKQRIVNDESMKELIEILKKERRINQKDLVKMLKLSDAKISLMLTELEKEGIIKKIKKGRSNIIIFKG